MKIVVVTGGRRYGDRDAVWRALDAHAPDLVIQGFAPTGADAHALAWTRRRCTPNLDWPARWSSHGPAAGPMRNVQMMNFARQLADAGHRVLVLAFPGGRGTESARRAARDAILPVLDAP